MARRLLVLLALAAPTLGVPATACAAEAPPAAPRLGACAPSELTDEDYRERKRPIPVPPAFAGLAVADMDHFAIATEGGGTVCVDAGWMEGIAQPRLSADRRFLSFAWGGYEAFGYVVVDRAGAGMAIETGTAPRFSPAGTRFASVDFSESGFGGFDAFGVWQVEPAGSRPLAKVQDDVPGGDWRIDGWAGEGCVNLSVIPNERYPIETAKLAKAPRDPWFAAQTAKWRLQPGRCPAR